MLIQPATSTPGQVLVDLDIAEQRAGIGLIQADILKLREEILKREEDIVKHEERIRELWNKRNACSSVAKLHPEILQEIFLIFQRSRMPVDYTGRRNDDSFRSWNLIMSVCRYWRTLAINTPTLWTFITNARFGRCNLHLQRSITAPLDVQISLGSYHRDSLAIAQSVMNHVARVRYLDIHNDSSWVHISKWDELQHSFESSLDDNTTAVHGILETLHIDIEGRGGIAKLSTKWFTIAPRLQHLRLKGVDFAWECISLPHIRTLEVDFLRSAAPISLAQLRKSLQKMAFIQALTLSNLPLQHEAAFPPTPSSKLGLPSLAKLKIESHSSASIARLLTTMTFPRALEYFQVLITSPANGPTLDDGHSDFFQALSGVPQEQYDLINIRGDYLRYWDNPHPRAVAIYMGFIATHDERCDFTGNKSPFKVNLPLNQSETSSLTVITNFFHIIANPNCLTQLCLTLKLPSQYIRSTFGSLPHLSVIKTLGPPAFESLVDALVIPINQPQDAPLSFPALTRITAMALRYPDISRYYTENKPNWNRLLDCLMQRYEYGAPIDILEIEIFLTDDEFEFAELIKKEFQVLKEFVPNYCLYLSSGW